MSLPDPLRSRAVLIGTSQYEHMPPIPAVENNLQELSKLLQSADLWGLPAANCIVVSNPQTAIDMLDPLQLAAEEARDTLIVYFAGHGLVHSTGSDLYLSLVGSDDKRMYRSVAYDHVRDELRASRARRRIVILDCCYSGRAFGLMNGVDQPTERVANGAALRGTYLMAAAGENKTAEAGDEYTAFSGELISLIQKGIPDQPDLLDVDTLFTHAREALQDKGLPVPQKREEDFSSKLILFRNRAHGRITKEHYGPIPGVTPGALFPNRHALHNAKIHRPLQAGICGTAARGGAESIVVSGGYNDDEDYGNTIIYTGHGGRDPNTGEQIKDQSPTDSGNAALIKSVITGLPVRVVRGSGGNKKFSPASGYSYDGLFAVTDYWAKPGTDGPAILQFRLEKLIDHDVHSRIDLNRKLHPGRWELVAPGSYADRSLATEVKQIYDYACQICGVILEAPGGLKFAATVHIRGLEMPHSGPDVKENMLCLCSNHRDLFKYGAITIEDDFRVIDQTDGEIITNLTLKHKVDLGYIRYHRKHHMIGQQHLIVDLD
ncbi:MULTISPECIES: caspase, EACC1-associated type [Streptosporangium]|uniref:Restriction endonuclease n=1 Tax=Streptosporangium brasiliense TaxID=47480 RepID=A0ABT9R6B9_9ACTN|nr:YDG/SRA domain-containing protein [Streptosporangium brasiliense]MDP9864798.1 putative restriction endonuclease [Streptosporangium brasiliense]